MSSGGTYTRLVQIERDLAEADSLMRTYIHGRISPAIADVLEGSGNQLVDVLHQVRTAAQIAREELFQEDHA